MTIARYLNLTDDNWDDKISAGMNMLEQCGLCPNSCNVNRVKVKHGFCKSGFFMKISSAFAHTGEEPPISGTKGSGTIFFSGCTMRCDYCQNYPISQQNLGTEMPFSKVADYMICLQNKGCHNINLVTPTHYIPQILIALREAVGQGLSIPIVYNTSGYETPEGLRLMDGIVDIYLSDMRYAKNKTAEIYSHIKRYADYNRTALKEMSKQVGEMKFDNQGIAKSGLIVRLLILPGLLDELRDNIKFLASQLPATPYISLMNQYFPTWKAIAQPQLNRSVTLSEFEQGISYLEQYGLDKGWIQHD